MKLKCNDKVWRQIINGVCQDCMQRIQGNPAEHICKRLDEFPEVFNGRKFKPARNIMDKQPLEDMPLVNRQMLAKANKFMNYGKKV